ncbi:NUDIX hydrolase [Desulfoluna spongiiphila]|uniref:NUDIX domain-containing protein n=1 Tax=Desulfoluna spongiiphila TaxID=419481 RepID=A0A1G5HCY7_9BACT|nr:CoA pyrophosphatase [Desulfoluna spongiiphila]SCY61210.1 NUDIX domain-containing protein [Desulfoluna spongiiphila]VVS94609.1 nudix hydrolase domain [Desulfoluna spongiiphila]
MDAVDQLRQALSGRPGVLGWDRFIHSAVLAPVVRVDGELHLLFQTRTEGIRQGGEISFPGGGFDPSQDEDLRATALRECCEEMGIAPDKVTVIGELDTLITSVGVTVSCYVGVLEDGILETMTVNEDEVAGWFTLPLSFFRETDPVIHHVRLMVEPHYDHPKKGRVTLLPAEALGLPKRYHKPWGGLTREVYLWETSHGTLWGITAELVRELIMRTPGATDEAT